MSDKQERKEVVPDQEYMKEKTSEEIIEETMQEIKNDMMAREMDSKEDDENENEEISETDAKIDKQDDEQNDEEITLDEENSEDIGNNDDSDVIYFNDDDFDGEAGDEAVDQTEDIEVEDEEFDGDLEDGNKKGKDKKKSKKKALIIVGGIVGVFLLVYLGFSVFFMSHFYFNTKINGVDFSAKTTKDVEIYMKKQVEGYQLSIQEINNVTEVINGADISMRYVPGKNIESALKDQNPFLWVKAFFSKKDADVTIEVDYNKEQLTQKINALNCVKPENQTDSASAAPAFDGNQYTIGEEVVGTKLVTDKFTEAIANSIGQFKPTVDLKKEGCYTAPKFTKESKEVAAARDAMNKYITASITYDFNPVTEVVDKALISTWLAVDENMGVVFNTDAVGSYLEELAGKYNTVGKTRPITTPDGKATQVSGGTYGWKIDYDTELQALITSIQNGEVVTRAPAYSQTAVTHGENDWGDTYIEVDLSNQQMWYISGGGVAFQTAVVTGKPDPKHETPEGTYDILEKLRNKTLKGEVQSDGQPEYETPVDYWMRVTYTGIGFHDANWQSSFGGSRYRDGYGSHGCINMAPSDAAALYGMIQNGVPVIMHY